MGLSYSDPERNSIKPQSWNHSSGLPGTLSLVYKKIVANLCQEQWFSNWSMYQNLLMGLLKYRLLNLENTCSSFKTQQRQPAL